MKVKDLLQTLKDLPEDYHVLISSDPEGNDFHKLSNDYSLAFYERGEEPILEGSQDVDEEIRVNAIILWP